MGDVQGSAYRFAVHKGFMFTRTSSCVCPGEGHRPEPRDVLRGEWPPYTNPEGQENGAEEPLQRTNRSALRQDQDVNTNRDGGGKKVEKAREGVEGGVISNTPPRSVNKVQLR